FRTRLRPVNVCAIVCLSIRIFWAAGAPLRTAAIHRDYQDKRRGCPVLDDSGLARTAALFTLHRGRVWARHLTLRTLRPPSGPGLTRSYRYWARAWEGRLLVLI